MKELDMLSIVIPVYNEEDSITLLYEKVKNVCESLNLKYEIIFIDDGSRDNTLEILSRIHESDVNVKVIAFRKNYGQTAAMAAGFDYSKGNIIISMDGDLQNDPADIPDLLKKIDEGYDLVCGWRKDRKDKLISRRIPSIVANWLISLLTGVDIHDNGCSLKAYKSNVIKGVSLYSEMHRFIPAMASMGGARITEIVVNHHARKFGEAKYGISRVWKVFLDLFMVKMLVGFSMKPALWFGMLSVPFLLLSILFMIMSGLLYASVNSDANMSIIYPAISFLLLFLGFQLNVYGMFSELVLRTGKPRKIDTMEEIE